MVFAFYGNETLCLAIDGALVDFEVVSIEIPEVLANNQQTGTKETITIKVEVNSDDLNYARGRNFVNRYKPTFKRSR